MVQPLWWIDAVFAPASGGHCVDPQHLQRAVALRHERCILRRIARLLALPLSTVGRTLKAMGLWRLKHLQAPVPVRRY